MLASAKRKPGEVTLPHLLLFIEAVVYVVMIMAAASGFIDGMLVRNQIAIPGATILFIVLMVGYIAWGRNRPQVLHEPRWALLFTLYAVAAVHATTAYDLPANYPFSPLHMFYYAVLIAFGAAGSLPLFITSAVLIISGELVPVGRYLFDNIQSEGVFQTLTWQLMKMLPAFLLMVGAGLIGVFMAPFRVIVKKVEVLGSGRAAEPRRAFVDTTTIDTVTGDTPPRTGAFTIDKSEFARMQEMSVSDELRSLVFFMHRNFGAYSALCFLFDNTTRSFSINTFESRNAVNINAKSRIGAGQGVVGNIAVTGQPFISGDIMQYNLVLGYYTQPEAVNSVLAVPVLRYDENRRPIELLGALVIDSRDKLAFRDNHRDALNRFAIIAGALISNVRGRLYQERTAAQFQAFYEAGRSFVSAHKASEVLDILVENIRTVLPTISRVVDMECDANTGKYTIRKIGGLAGELKEGMTFPLNDSIYSTVIKTKTPVSVVDFEVERSKRKGAYYRFVMEEPMNPDVRSLAVIPISVDDEETARCVISVEHSTPGMFQGEAGTVLQTLVTNASVAYQKAVLYQRMETLATTDGLTGLINHRTFQEYLHREIIRAHRYQHELSLLLLDIDHFKKFNDTYGHQTGDLVLQEVANSLRKVVREHDVPARYGGEEFVVIIPETATAAAASIADRIRKAVESLVVYADGKELKVTVSIGCATIPTHVGTQPELIEKADKAMYVSKNQGRNRVTIYTREMG